MAQCQWKLTRKPPQLQTNGQNKNMEPHVVALLNVKTVWAKNLFWSLWPKKKFSQANSEWKQQRTWTTAVESWPMGAG